MQSSNQYSAIMRHFLTIALLAISSFLCTAHAGSFEAGKGTFLLNGKPFTVKAAELHYARIPRPYWEHRIKMCKALGMNTICIYIFWNKHEQREGVFNWSDDCDIAAFCRLCQKNGMYVIVRPGPYVCAEWEMGGLPWWLLKKRDISLRDCDPYFLECVKRFETEVGKQLAPLTIENGGPIIMMQVENEYGSYAENKPYVSEVRDILRSVGFDKTVLFQCDWSSNFEMNALPDLLWTMNFGTGAKVLDQFKRVKQLRPDQPLMCSEYWSGWFDGWGTSHQTRPYDAMVNGIKTMLDNNISFSLYMAHGGTSFAQWAGANNKGFAPDCTSYDYDAPINEQGAATEKYYKLRELLQGYSDTKLPDVPKPMPIIQIPEVSFDHMMPLLRAGNMPEPVSSHDVMPMEQYDLGYGSILYSTTMPAVKAGTLLQINDMCDYAIVYVNDKKVGELYRGNGYETTLRLPEDVAEGSSLDIFIEAMGRINYSKLINDPKGITRSVELLTSNGKDEVTYNLKDWKVYRFPIYDDAASIDSLADNMSAIPGTGSAGTPAYYKASFSLKKTGDTYLDMSSWGKGLVWVNGHCLGRFWNVGPQQTLFLPGCWLKKGKNRIVVLDITGPAKASLRGLAEPVVDQLHREFLPKDAVKGKALKEALAGRAGAPKAKAAADGGQGNDAAPGAK